MVMISNVDLVMATLRSRLQRIASEKRTGKAQAGQPTRVARRGERGEIEALEAMRHLPEEEFDRALVRAMLETELGEGVAADARFHRLVDHTARILRDSDELRAMFRQIQAGND